VKRIEHHIGGAPVPPASGTYLINEAPATGAPLAEIPRGSATDVEAAVNAARTCLQGPWSRTSARQRSDLLYAIAAGLEARAEELAHLESEDTGKPIGLARAVDVPRAIENFRFFAGALLHDETGCHPMQHAINYTLRRPVGVVGLITPWNLPLYLLSWKTAPALAMGNSIVAKPSEITPMTASVLAEVIAAAGAPAGVFNLVHGLGPDVGAPIVSHPAIRGISFTGGTATGKTVATAAAPHFKKLSLELGGKNATVVFADADLALAADGAARAAFLNQGQICLCGSRILVQAPIYRQFVTALTERAAALKPANPLDAETMMGSLVSSAHREKVEAYIRLAREEGGTIIAGGARPELPEPWCNGAFLQPTIIDGLSSCARTATEEIFGPVVTVHPFDTEADALEMANETEYGLSASLWTRDLSRAHRFSAQLDVGMVWVNTWLLRDLRVPFGGVKNSGVGREGGKHSLEFFSEAQNICVALEVPS
jgi:aminomuconate-semialdehyde/2-hydroxymuconate-6-semialdehyde dehydrogenase